MCRADEGAKSGAPKQEDWVWALRDEAASILNARRIVAYRTRSIQHLINQQKG